jgi:hypothetical protein
MATGRGNQLTKQIGEYLVAAELGRRGYVAATFSGNIPDYDIVATDGEFKSVPVQVKAITGNSWQLNFSRFAVVRFEGQRQIVERPLRLATPIACVMVALGEYGQDRFYVLEWRQLRDILVRGYRANLKKKNGIRPKRFDSLHTAVSESQLAKYRDNWGLIAELCKLGA